MVDDQPRVLLICYYFPPLGGAGINRPLQLYRSLPDQGIVCDILTVKPVTYRVYEPELEPRDGVGRIFRSGSRDPQRLMYLLGKRSVSADAIERGRTVSNRFFPDPKVGWVKPATSLGRTIVENRHHRAIISTSPPVSAHLVAKQLCTEFKLPWIADFRDLWTALPIQQSYDSDRSRSRAEKLRKEIRSGAQRVVAVNGSVGEYVGATDIIPNAWHEQFASVWKLPQDDGRVVIGVLGTINELYPIEPLFKLLVKLKRENPAVYDRLSVLHVGASDRESLRQLAERHGVADVVESTGRLSRLDTIERLSSASVFYIATDAERGKAFSTGRIYTLLPSGRPILAYCDPDSELANLVSTVDHSRQFDNSSMEPAAEWLVDSLQELLDGQLQITLQPSYAQRFSESALAESYATVIKNLIADQS